MRFFLLLVLLSSCAPKLDNSYAQLDVSCPKEGMLAMPMTIQCKCSDPGSSRGKGLMSVIGGAVGIAVETLTD